MWARTSVGKRADVGATAAQGGSVTIAAGEGTSVDAGNGGDGGTVTLVGGAAQGNALTDSGGESSEAGPLIPPELEGPLVEVLEWLVGDAAARATLVEVLVLALVPARAPGVLTDVAVILEADVIGEILDLIVALASKTCEAP